MRTRGAARQAVYGAARIGIPVGSTKPCKCRHDVDPRRILNRQGKGLAFLGAFNDAQFVTQPLNKSPGHEYASLEGVFEARSARRTRRNRAHQTVGRFNRHVACVHEHEAARAIGIFGTPRFKTTLPEQSRLLIARNTANRNTLRKARIRCNAVIGRRGSHFGKHRAGNAEQIEQFIVPFARMDVEQHGTACVGDIGRMHQSAG